MLRILHTGDLHLDSPFRGLTPEKARLRREEQRTLLERIRTLAEERQVDVVLIAGDLFDGDCVYYETTRMLVDTFASMSARVLSPPAIMTLSRNIPPTSPSAGRKTSTFSVRNISSASSCPSTTPSCTAPRLRPSTGTMRPWTSLSPTMMKGLPG